MKISKNKLLATALILTTVLTIFASSRLPVGVTDYIDEDEYCWIEGVLHNDTYALYPYRLESLDIGFSKYGELIGYDETTGIGLGLQYPGYTSAGNTYDQKDDTSRDPFANEWIRPESWLRGWFIDIKYEPIPGTAREVWAFAMFSDGFTWGGDWHHMTELKGDDIYDLTQRQLWQEYPPFANLQGAPGGGRKTNGWAVSDPIDIVYNGPRKLVAVTKTRISDYYEATGTIDPLVDVYITFIFNKVSKSVILLKDVKRINPKYRLNVQFGNRGEWDLGPRPGFASYVHFYTDNPVMYLDDPDEFEFFKKWMLEKKYPKKWWEDETQYTCYGVDPDHEWHVDHNIVNHGYAVGQVISSDLEYVGAVGIWPHPEFWSVQRSFMYTPTMEVTSLMLTPLSRLLEWSKWTTPPRDPVKPEYPEGKLPDRIDQWIAIDDMTFPWTEPDIPWLISEHDFELSGATYNIYRVVCAYVLTDLHDADDANIVDEPGWGITNRIDREIRYQLQEIFNPWDINQAMHKETKRWVAFGEGDGEATCFELPDEMETEEGLVVPTLPVYPGYEAPAIVFTPTYYDWIPWQDYPWGPWDAWDSYCSFAERVLVDGELIPRYLYQDIDPYLVEDSERKFYEIYFNTGLICFWIWDDDEDDYIPWEIPDGAEIKVLWSTAHTATVGEQWEWDPDDPNNKVFPLHHDITPELKHLTEVFLVEQKPERLWEYYDYGTKLSETITVTEELLCVGPDSPGAPSSPAVVPAGTTFRLAHPFVEAVGAVYHDETDLVLGTHYRVNYCVDEKWTEIILLLDIDLYECLYCEYKYWDVATITIFDVPEEWFCKEVDFKYHIPWTPCGMGCTWVEEKRHIDRVPVPGPMDLAFVIDDTATMWDEIDAFQAALDEILDDAAWWSGGDIRYSLVTFNDTVRVVQDWTTSRTAVETAINALPSGYVGAWYPEASDEALNTTVNELSAAEAPCQIGDFSAWRDDVQKLLILFTDAEPGGCDDTYSAADLANGKTWAAMAAVKGIVISAIEGDTTSMPDVTTEALRFYADVTGGVYIKIDGIDIADAVKAAYRGITFTLSYPADYIEKVWHHSEKAITGGDYVFCGEDLVMQDPVAWSDWLYVTYESGGIACVDVFHGDGQTTEFELRYTPDVGTLQVYNAYIWEEIVPQNATVRTPVWPMVGRAPDPVYAPQYVAAPWKRYGIAYPGTTIMWEEREWLVLYEVKTKGNYVIHETEDKTCDELVLNQPLNEGEELKIIYEVPSGRYEWTIVGNHSRAIDSAGAAMVTAAFKNKYIEIGISGLDVQDTGWGPEVPYTLRDFGYLGTGRHPAIDYYDNIGRLHLKDDWCETWAVSSSNIITIGGAPANIMSEYWNDFTDAFMTRWWLIDAIYCPTCWDRNDYPWEPVDERYGHAVIATYKDINGTVGFIIWGWTGQDTYYACKWFDEQKFWLQHINPHVTALVLEIDYHEHPPEVEIVETLGTISEKPQHDP